MHKNSNNSNNIIIIKIHNINNNTNLCTSDLFPSSPLTAEPSGVVAKLEDTTTPPAQIINAINDLPQRFTTATGLCSILLLSTVLSCSTAL